MRLPALPAGDAIPTAKADAQLSPSAVYGRHQRT